MQIAYLPARMVAELSGGAETLLFMGLWKETAVFAGQPVLTGVHILDRLRAAGIPVQGSIWPIGIENGEMHVTMNDAATTFEWEPEDDDIF